MAKSPGRRPRLVLIIAMGIVLSSALSASARVGVQASASLATGTTAATHFPLSVRHASVRELAGRIVGTATIVNTSGAAVRPTTGSLGLDRSSQGNATGLATFSVGALAPNGSETVRFRTPRTRALGVGSGAFAPVICTDVYSQIQRFASDTHCARAATLTIAGASKSQTGPAPDTRVITGLAKVTTSAAAVLRFTSTIAHSRFQCSLDGGPWLGCRNPQRYSALVDGAHVFRVRALSPTGITDPSPARVSWAVDRALPSVQVSTPLNASTVKTSKPTFAGRAGTAAGDASTVSVHLFAGSRTSGLPVQTLVAPVSAGKWSVAPSQSVPNGTYTLTVEQSDRAGHRGVSTPRTFSVDVADSGRSTVGTADASSTTSTTATTTTTTTTTTPTTSTSTTTTTTPPPPVSGQDGFDRADGGLGAGWAPMSDGGASIASDVVVGTADATDGDLRVGEAYGSDQFSQVEVTGTQLSGGQWIGASVRGQNGGQDTYLGIYFWNNGDQQLRLYKRAAGAFTQLGSSVESGALPAGTQLRVSAVGSQVSLSVNGTARIAVSDTSLTGGAPGIMTFGAATLDNWQGGTPFSVGGSVSGLSGTVVLQNNGKDDLSLSAGGAFTFATPLVSGAAYSVTVKSSPSGQTCSVSGGSGTLAAASVTSVVVTCSAIATPAPGQDDFNRADGGLGSSWEPSSDGGASIASDVVVGTAAATDGDLRVGEAYGSDQFSQVEVTGTQLSGGQWIGASVRGQNGGQDTYLGIYFWNNGDQQLQLYKRAAGTFTQLGSSVESGALPAGTQLTVSAVGSQVSLSVNGTVRIAVSDGTLTGGAPGIMTFGAATLDNWQGGTPAQTYSVGGSVSGLSGTVVLQDNGKDDLSLNGNGVFRFATPLVSGAAYDVTVKNSPGGQTCSVSGGSGTVAAANVTSVVVTCSAISTPAPGQDGFDRANGALGAGWEAMNDGGLSIASDAVVGTAGATDGDIRVGEAYGSDQFSQVEVTSTQLSGGEWIGASVRGQNGGQDTYVGIYFWNNGDPQLRLYERSGGAFTQLGSSFESGALPAGTQLTVSAVGSEISFSENGTVRIAVSDTSLTGGAPGIMTFGAATLDNWQGGTPSGSTPPPAGIQTQFAGTDANGVQDYNFTSSDDGGGTHMLRVLTPTDPAPGVPHNFLYVLPVEPEQGTTFGDGLETLRALDAQDKYNLTIIEPSFAIDPWYADNPTDPSVQYETFMTEDLVPWVTQNFSVSSGTTSPFTPLSGPEQNWLIGFSKSGIGGEDLILKHPDVFSVAASWDFPADMASYSDFDASSEDEYGTDANFQANYRLTPSFLAAHKAPFTTQNRIWIGSFDVFQPDVADYDQLLTSEGILHSTETPTEMAHRWDSGWVPIALSALSADSTALNGAL